MREAEYQVQIEHSIKTEIRIHSEFSSQSDPSPQMNKYETKDETRIVWCGTPQTTVCTASWRREICKNGTANDDPTVSFTRSGKFTSDQCLQSILSLPHCERVHWGRCCGCRSQWLHHGRSGISVPRLSAACVQCSVPLLSNRNWNLPWCVHCTLLNFWHNQYSCDW